MDCSSYTELMLAEALGFAGEEDVYKRQSLEFLEGLELPGIAAIPNK